MHIYAFAALTDIATIVYNNGARRTEHPLNTGIAWLCRTVLCILLSKSRDCINIHFVVMRSILRNSYQKPSWTWHRTRLRSNTIYEFAVQFTNASYMVANRYSFNPTPNNQKNGTPKEKKHKHQPDKNKHDKQKLEAHRNPDADMHYDFFIVHGLSKRGWRHCGQRFNSKENFACNKGKQLFWSEFPVQWRTHFGQNCRCAQRSFTWNAGWFHNRIQCRWEGLQQ